MKTELEILDYLLTPQNWRPPGLRQIAEDLDKAPSTIHHHLTALVARGHIERKDNGEYWPK